MLLTKKTMLTALSSVTALMPGLTVSAWAENKIDTGTYSQTLVTGDGNTVQKDGDYVGPSKGYNSQQIYGQNNTLTGSTQSDVIGDANNLKNADATVVGQSNTVENVYGTSVGDANHISGQLSHDGKGWQGQVNNLGGGNTINNSGENAAVNNVGSNNFVDATGASGMGNYQKVTANNSVTLGDNSTNERDNSVSVGTQGSERQITNVAAGTAGTDAVNLDQMKAGDAETLKSANEHTDTSVQAEANARVQGDAETLKSANEHTDTSVQTEANARVQGDAETLKSANEHTDTSVQTEANARVQGDVETLKSANEHTDKTAVQYDRGSNATSVTLKARGGTQIHNLKAGTAGTDAVNLDQMKAGDVQTLNQANNYTDNRVTDLGKEMNNGFSALNGRVDNLQRHAYAGIAGAIAMSSIPQASPGHSLIGAGFGHFAGQQAAAFGYSHHWVIDDHRGVIVKAGGMVTNQSDGGAMFGVGYEW